MLQLIIDAYEEKNKDENFFKSLKKMDKLNRTFYVIIILGLALTFILFVFKKFDWGIYAMVGWIIMVFLFTYIITVRGRKKWKENIVNYNEKLDCLKGILCEDNINCYSKNKIAKLIAQCEKSINDLVFEKEKTREKRNGFMDRYILPIIAFGAGALSGKIDITELMQICVFAIFIIVIINLDIWGFDMFIEEITGNELEKRKYLLVKLEDLLVRDFEITDSDVKNE